MSTLVERNLLTLILSCDLLVLLRVEPREAKVGGDVATLESLLYFLLEDNELVFHFRVDISLVISRPEAPKSIADYVTEASFPFLTENIMPQLRQDLLSLN